MRAVGQLRAPYGHPHVVTEGVFTIPAEGARNCGGGNLEGSFAITVEDDDGPIPGRVTRSESETRNGVAWAPEANAERRPATAKNVRATVHFYTTYSREMNGPTEAFEEGSFTLDVATDPTPDPTPPVITDARAQLSVQDMWSEGPSPCRRATTLGAGRSRP